jgi:hypothetical protein
MSTPFMWAVGLAVLGGLVLSLAALVPAPAARVLPALALGVFTAAGILVLIGAS